MRLLYCIVALTVGVGGASYPRAGWSQPAAGEERRIEPPRLVEFVEAEFPESEREHQRGATVLLQVAITEIGEVAEVAVLTSAGPAFDAAAAAAVRQFRFEPARVDGKPIPVKIDYAYEFVWREELIERTTADFEGTIRDRKTKAPLAGIRIELDDGQAVVTDEQGRFRFEDLAPGPRTFTVSGADMTTVSSEEELEAGQRIEVVYEVELREEEEDIDFEFVVTAPRVQRQVVATEVATADARRIPGTQGDVLKVVENLPGVARSAAGSAALVVWGAAPEDTRVYVDGLRIPRLYHDGGYRSVLHSDMVRSVELVPGGYGPAYGRGLGGMVNVRLRPLDEDGFGGSIAADVIDASAAARAQVSDRVRVSMALRRSHLHQLAPLVAEDADDIVPIPGYHDAQARIGYELGPHERVELGGLLSSDRINRTVISSDPVLTARDTREVDFQRIYARYDRRVSDVGRINVLPSIGWDQSRLLNRFGGVETSVENHSAIYGLRASWRGDVAEHIIAEVGFDADFTSSRVRRAGAIGAPPREGDERAFGQAPADQVNADEWRTLIGSVVVYGEVDIGLLGGKLRVLPGFRFEPYVVSTNRRTPRVGTSPDIGHTFQETVLEPRLTMRYQVAAPWSVKLAYGHYHQPPQAEDLSAVFGTPTLTLSRARHYLAGTAYDITETLDVEVTAFLSESSDLVGRSLSASPFLARALTQNGAGRSYGAQFLLRQQHLGPIFGWLSYTFMCSERRDDPESPWRRFDYDQTHVLTAVSSYDLGRDFEVGARLRYATGFPRTPISFAYYDAATNTFQPVFGARNSIRIPPFVSVDLRGAKTFRLGDGSELEVYLDVSNITNRRNPEELVYDPTYQQSDYIAGFPTMAVLGARFAW